MAEWVKELASQVLEPEFGSKYPCKKLDVVLPAPATVPLWGEMGGGSRDRKIAEAWRHHSNSRFSKNLMLRRIKGRVTEQDTQYPPLDSCAYTYAYILYELTITYTQYTDTHSLHRKNHM